MSSEIPRYPSTPAPQLSSTLPARPRVVTAAFWCFLAAAFLELVVTIFSLVAVASERSGIAVALRQDPRLPGRHIDVETLVGVESIAVLVVGVIAIVLYVVFPILLRRGFGWARIVLLVVTAISLLGATGDYGVSALKVIVAIVATMLAFLTPASQWFRAAKQLRLERRFAR